MQPFILVNINKQGLCKYMLLLAAFAGMVACFTSIDFYGLHQSLRESDNSQNKISMLNYELFIKNYGKHYLTIEEKNLRYQIYLKNVKEINELQNSGKISHKLAVNQFADMTNDEYINYAGLHKTKLNDAQECAEKHTSDTNKADIDWMIKGAVTNIKDSGPWGPCCTDHAFSAIAAVEALYITNGHIPTNLSEQEVIECAYEGITGCNAWTDTAFNYIMNVGITADIQYPYIGRQENCKNTSVSHVFKIKGCKDITYQDLDALQDALNINVISISICAECFAFQFYSSGVIQSYCCTEVDHRVALVSSGIEDGTAYWKIKNSWGRHWGDVGYVKVLKETGKNSPGMCGIAMEASYPIA